jgi:lysophospholipase L1-like esterase
MFFEQRKKIVFAGDSITDSGRRDVAIPYGNGYVSVIRSFLLARYPELGLTIVNKGVSGNTVRELAARWETDVIAERPDYLSICVGINDVIRQFDSNNSTAVYPDEYRNTLRSLIKRAQETSGARLILMTPYMIETDRNKPVRKQLDAYGAIVTALAGELFVPVVKVQDAFDNVLKYTTPTFWSDDQFHPNGPGHAVIAQAFLKVVGYTLA